MVNPKLQIVNDGCPGETTETFINGSGVPGFCAGGPTGTPFPYAFLHHPYTPRASQLADALAILKEKPNVSPLTLDIGANDVLQFLALNVALAGVAATVPGTSFANPEPPFNPSILTGLPETTDLPTICAFTAMCPGGTFNPASPNADIHPTDLGYGVMAGVVGVDFFSH